MRGPLKKSSIFASSVPRKLEKKTEIPGPGAYEAKSTLRVSDAPQQFQFFGSSVARYLGPPAPTAAPGPGSYEHAASFVEGDEEPLLTNPSGFGAAAPRGLNIDQSNALEQERGPGAYQDLPNISYELSRKVFGRCGSFGTTAARFNWKKKQQRGVKANPGPGTYTQKRLLQPPRKLGVFSSGVPRLKEAKPRAPGPGNYNPRGFVSESSTYNNKESSMFALKQGRFDNGFQQRQVMAAANRGPGTYADAVPDTKVAQGVFNSKSIRFEKIRNEAPGPGSYVDPNMNLIKPTYNATISNDFAR